MFGFFRPESVRFCFKMQIFQVFLVAFFQKNVLDPILFPKSKLTDFIFIVFFRKSIFYDLISFVLLFKLHNFRSSSVVFFHKLKSLDPSTLLFSKTDFLFIIRFYFARFWVFSVFPPHPNPSDQSVLPPCLMPSWTVWFKFVFNRNIGATSLFTLISFNQQSAYQNVMRNYELSALSRDSQKVYSVSTLVTVATDSTGGIRLPSFSFWMQRF